MATTTEPQAAGAATPEPPDRLSRTWTDPGGIGGWIITVQNGPIAGRFIFTTFVFFLLAGVQALVMRLQLARPESDLVNPQLYNGLFTMHGSTMMFLFAVPFMEALANLVLPPLLGARELPFPRMTGFGYWTFLFGGIFFYTSFLFGALPDGGWFAYVPLTSKLYSPGLGIDFWLLGLSVAEVAALGAGIELTVAILKMRAPGMAIHRLPLYCWAILVMGFMMLFGFTPLLVSTTLLELDRLVGTQFFNPAGGGDPILWQHLFWIFGHPDVYIMFVPATGIVSMVVATFARQPVATYPLIVMAIVATAIISFGLWVHHMFTTGLPELGLGFFAAASMTIGVAAGIQVFAWLATIWRGRPVWSTAFLFVIGFIVTFVLGGFTGIMVAAVPFDWQVHDSYLVVAHFHYVLIGGVVFPIFAALYYWMPAMTGRLLDERLGVWSFWLTFVGFHLAFFPMHILGLLGMPRRYYTYEAGLGWEGLNLLATAGALLMALGVLVFVGNVVHSLFLSAGREAPENPWGAGTLDWAQPLPAPNEGWRRIPIVRSRYPLWEQPDLQRGTADEERLVRAMEREPDTWRAAVITSVVDGQPVGIARLATPSWWPFAAAVMLTLVFIATLFSWYVFMTLCFVGFIACVIGWLWPPKEEREQSLAGAGTTVHGLPVYHTGPRAPAWWVMALILVIAGVALGCLLFSYGYLRTRHVAWPPAGVAQPDWLLSAIGVGVLLVSVVPLLWALRSIRRGNHDGLRLGLAGSFGLGALFLVLQGMEYLQLDFSAQGHVYGSLWYTLAGYQTVLVVGGLIICGVVQLWSWLGYFSRWRYLALLGLLMSAIFVFVILVEGLPPLFINPCGPLPWIQPAPL